jgi:hypothetical protein
MKTDVFANDLMSSLRTGPVLNFHGHVSLGDRLRFVQTYLVVPGIVHIVSYNLPTEDSFWYEGCCSPHLQVVPVHKWSFFPNSTLLAKVERPSVKLR